LESISFLMWGFSSCCKNISATVSEIGEPTATHLSGWHIWFWKVKWFCLNMVSSSMIIWLVFCLSLCIRCWVLINLMASFLCQISRWYTYHSTLTSPTNIQHYMDTIHSNIKLNPTHETNDNVNFLDLSITRKPTSLKLDI